MESLVKQLDSEQEFGEIKRKEEFFLPIGEQGCIGGTKDTSLYTPDELSKEDVPIPVHQTIVTDSNDVGLDEAKENLNEEQEIACVWVKQEAIEVPIEEHEDIEDSMLREQIERYNQRVRDFEEKQRVYRGQQDRGPKLSTDLFRRSVNVIQKVAKDKREGSGRKDGTQNTKAEEKTPVKLSGKSTIKDSEPSSLKVRVSRSKQLNGERPYTCKECGYTCNKSHRLKEHMRTHSRDKPYKCTECEFSCVHLGNLTKHMRRHTGEKPHKCKVCDYSCIAFHTLTIHMRLHTGEKPYKCKECEFSSSQLGNLKIHMKRHSGERPYKCKECDYSCVESGHLKTHMRTHTGERPHKCKLCPFSSTISSHLIVHMRSHTGERPFKCSECKFSCIRSNDLKVHMRYHTGEKPFKCEECDYSCATSHRLKLHMKTHSKERPYKCKDCDFSSPNLRNLNSHVRTHTEESQ